MASTDEEDQLDLAQPEIGPAGDQSALSEPDDRGFVNSITDELVRSYGFRVEPDWSVSWSLDNIATSWEERPVWTAIDWLLLGAPVLKWGNAARAVMMAEGAVGRAYKAGAGRVAPTGVHAVHR